MIAKSHIVITTLFLAILFIACSKEDEEITPYPYTPPNYDVGHLMVKITNNPGVVDSIEYTNLTKGFTSLIEKSELTYYQSNNYSALSQALANGSAGDQVRCCVYLNQATNIGVEFEFMSLDSISTTSTSSNIYCVSGSY